MPELSAGEDAEVVERAAQALWAHDAGDCYTRLGWDAMSAAFKDEWRERVRIVFAASGNATREAE